MPAGTVEVFLIGAVGIKDTEVFGKADPYAVLHCGKQKLRSNTASNQGSKPMWNQKFSFYIDDTAIELQIILYNRNILTEDDELGSTSIPLAKVFAENKLPTTSYNVLRPSGRVQGEVKLSLSFTAKRKPGQQAQPSSIPGPYSNKTHGSPYAPAIPPEPAVKHDPLLGADGYYKKNSSAAAQPVGSSHGGGGSGRYTYGSDSDSGSSKYSSGAYPQGFYPPVQPASQAPYGRTESGPGYAQAESFSSHGGHGGQYYPTPPSGDYSGKPPHEAAYGHGPPHLSGALPHLAGGFPKPGSSNMKPPRFEDLAGKFGSLNVSGSGSHGNYSGYHGSPTGEGPRPSYHPPPEPDYHGYSSHPPPPAPHGYGSPAGYPPSYDSSSANYSPRGYGSQSPPSSFYPPQLGIPSAPSSNAPPSGAYPPHQYYNGPPPQHYVPAGYPK